MDSSSVEEPLVQSGYTTTRGRYARGDRVCNKYVGSQYYRVLSTRCSCQRVSQSLNRRYQPLCPSQASLTPSYDVTC